MRRINIVFAFIVCFFFTVFPMDFQTEIGMHTSSTADILDSISKHMNTSKAVTDKSAIKDRCCGQVPMAGSVAIMTGKCYLGPGSDNIIDTGFIDFCYKPIQPDSADRGPCSDYLYMRPSKGIKKDGSYTVFLPKDGSEYYVLVNTTIRYNQYYYALQWLDGTPASEEPKPILIDKDTIYHDLHFAPGCEVQGTLTLEGGPATFATVLLVDPAGLVMGLDTCRIVDSVFSITGIPVGSYYLKISEDDYERPMYPGALSTADAQCISFTQAGTKIKLPNWTIKKKVYNTVWDTLRIKNPENADYGLSVYIIGIDNRMVSYYSGAYASFYKPVNTRYFITRVTIVHDIVITLFLLPSLLVTKTTGPDSTKVNAFLI